MNMDRNKHNSRPIDPRLKEKVGNRNDRVEKGRLIKEIRSPIKKVPEIKKEIDEPTENHRSNRIPKKDKQSDVHKEVKKEIKAEVKEEPPLWRMDEDQRIRHDRSRSPVNRPNIRKDRDYQEYEASSRRDYSISPPRGYRRQVSRDYSQDRSPPRRDRKNEHDDRYVPPVLNNSTMIKLDPVMEEQIRDPDFWEWLEEEVERECPVCRVSMTGFEPWDAHLTGRKHRNAMAQFGIHIPAPKKKEVAAYEVDLSKYPESDQPVSLKTPTGMQYKCNICSISVNDLHGYKAHIDGIKHKKRKKEVEKLGIVLASNEVCAICGFNLDKKCAMCETSKGDCEVQIGNCGHQFHGCCQNLKPLLPGKCLTCASDFEVAEIRGIE